MHKTLMKEQTDFYHFCQKDFKRNYGYIYQTIKELKRILFLLGVTHKLKNLF